MVWSRTVSTCSRLTPGNHDRKSSTVAPASRFSKSAMTGTRVPRKTHAPLTRASSCSTAEHVDQFIFEIIPFHERVINPPSSFDVLILSGFGFDYVGKRLLEGRGVRIDGISLARPALLHIASRVTALSHSFALFKTRPASAPVYLPSSTAILPLTITYRIPSASTCGCS